MFIKVLRMKVWLLLMLVGCCSGVRHHDRADKAIDYATGLRLLEVYLCTGSSDWVGTLIQAENLVLSRNFMLKQVIRSMQFAICEHSLWEGVPVNITLVESWYNGFLGQGTRVEIAECLEARMKETGKILFCCGHFSKQLTNVLKHVVSELCKDEPIPVCRGFLAFLNLPVPVELCKDNSCPFSKAGTRVKRQYDFESLTSFLKQTICGYIVQEIVFNSQEMNDWTKDWKTFDNKVMGLLAVLARRPVCCLLFT